MSSVVSLRMELPPASMSRFDAVESLVREHSDLETQMADPSVHSDPAKAKRLGQRYAELGGIVRTYREWQQVVDDIEAARELADEDPDFATEVERLYGTP